MDAHHHSYHVFVSAKPRVSAALLEERMIEFLDTQISGNHLVGYRILRYTDTATFTEMPSYQMICDYRNGEDLKKGFQGMRPERWKQDPHAGMMELVTDFRVSFSEDVVQCTLK